MKKAILVALALVFAAPLFAIDDDFDNVVYSSANNHVRFEVLSTFGYGYHIVKSNDFNSNGSSEFFFNVASLGLYPVDSFGLELGLDCAFNAFDSRNSAFILDNERKVQAMEFSTLVAGTPDRHRGNFDVFSLNIPAVAKVKIGDFSLGGGAVASFNLLGSTTYYYKQDNRREEVTYTRAQMNRFTYSFVATLGYGSMGAYFKYYPASSPLLPEGSVDMSYMTIGLVFDF